MSSDQEGLTRYRGKLNALPTGTAQSIIDAIDECPVVHFQRLDKDGRAKERMYRKVLEQCKREKKKTLIVTTENPELFRRLTKDYDVQVYRCHTREEIPAELTCSVIWAPPSCH